MGASGESFEDSVELLGSREKRLPRSVLVTYKVFPTPAELAAAGAQRLVDAATKAAAARGVARIAISGGTTPQAMFALLADRGKPYFAQMPWDKLQLFWVDERCVPPTDPQSNFGMTKRAMLDQVPLKPEQIFRMEGELDPETAASRYEAAMRTAFRLEGAETPAFDFIQLGMGSNMHTASLFPHTTALHELGRICVANDVREVNMWRITLTAPVLNHSRDVVFLIEKADKAEPLRDVLLGAYDPETKPSQLIRPDNGKLDFLLDTAAAAKLPTTADSVGTLQLS
jgi:6-phosphogluconolactonase